MPISHTLSSERDNDRNLWLELVDSLFDFVSNGNDSWELLISEVPGDLGHDLVSVVNDFLDLGCVDLIEWIIQPRVVAGVPLLHNCPQVVVIGEVFVHLGQGRVVSDVLKLG